jgi:cytochrome c peroxidase
LAVVGAAMTLATFASAGCGSGGFFCGSNAMCGWSDTDVARVAALANLGATPPDDVSNKYANNPDAAALGKMFYFDTRFSGPSTLLDGLNRTMPFGRTPAGQSAGVACVSCHDAGHAGADPASDPGNVSVGAGWTYNNSLSTFNSAFYLLHLWNGRADSLWAQAASDNENGLTTNGNRLRTAWLISDHYGQAYANVFTDPADPTTELPMTGLASADVQAMVDSTGQCVLAGGACPATCRAVTSTVAGAAPGCFPRFPLQGKPGKTMGCQPGLAGEPFGDAFDCMDPQDQHAVTQVLVNFAKAIAGYEQTLVLGPAPFDAWAVDLQAGHGDSSTAVPDAAKTGALLFVGKAGCSDCHNTALFSDGKFHNIGVGQTGPGVPTIDDCPAGGVCDCAPVSDDHPNGPKNCLPFGARDGIQKLQANAFRRDGMWSDQMGDTSALTYVDADLATIPIGAYRTPSLRNVSLTAPYMHDGSMTTLADVVWHYSQGIPDQTNPGAPAASFQPLYLSGDEQAALVAFLESLVSAPPPASVLAPPMLPP